MRILKTLLFSFFLFLLIGGNTLSAQDKTGAKKHGKQVKHSQKFVDKNGDGYNDNAPDHDGDGIPNSLDPDWQKLQKQKKKHKFIDLNGDGINDYMQKKSNKKHVQSGHKQIQRAGSAAGDQPTMRQRHGQMKRHGGRH